MNKSPEERFWIKINKHSSVFGENGNYDSECWVWTGSLKHKEGYGRFWLNGKIVLAHRYMYELIHGTIDTSMTIDHLCRVRNCVNPNHLEQVSHKENVLRGVGCTAVASRKTHCPNGHPYNKENTRINHKGSRECRTCYRQWRRKIRGYKGNVDNKDKIYCKRGHKFTIKNTYVIPTTGSRQCLRCKKEGRKRYVKN